MTTSRPDSRVLFTWTAQQSASPLEIVRGEGASFWTADGKQWIDFESQVFNAHLGFNHTGVKDAIRSQLDQLCVAHPAAVYEAKTALGNRIASVLPDGLGTIFLTLGGAEANENALKIARLFTGREKAISRYRSYHGATYGALTLTGDRRRRPFQPGIPGVIHVEPPTCNCCPWGRMGERCAALAVARLSTVIEMEGPTHIAALFVEPISGASGGFMPPASYLQAVRALCDEHSILLVADEVLTGFGRTGKWFAFEHAGIVPDMVTLAKGLTAGYATLGAVAMRDDIGAHFEENILWAGLTGYGHPLSCAAAVGAIDAIKNEGLVERSAEWGRTLLERVEHLQARHDVVAGARGEGLFCAFELVADDENRVPLVHWDAQGDALEPTRRFREALSRLGLHLAVRGHTVYLAPPLTISEALLDEGLDRLDQALQAGF